MVIKVQNVFKIENLWYGSNSIYLGLDGVLLVAFLVLLLQLLPDLLGQGRPLFTSLGLVLDPPGGVLDLGFGVHAVLGTFQVILGLLVVVTANTALLSLQPLAGFDGNVLTIEGQGKAVVRSIDLDNVVLGKQNLSKLLSFSRPQGLPLALLNLLFLSVDNNLQGLLDGGDPDFRLSQVDLDFLLLARLLELTGQNTILLLLGAVSGQDVEALVQVQGEGLVVEGPEGLAFNLTDGVHGVVRDLLGDQLDVVDASLQGEDFREAIGQPDLLELELFLRAFNGEVKAGGLLVEPQPGVDGSRLDGVVGGGGVLAFRVVLQEGPHEGLEDGDGIGFKTFDVLGNVLVLDSDLDFIQSTSLLAHGLAGFGQLSNDRADSGFLFEKLHINIKHYISISNTTTQF